MKLLVGVLAVASLCLAEPEADPYYGLYSPYLYSPYYRPYFASGYHSALPGNSYQSVHRLHKREAEADPQLLFPAATAPLAAAPLVAAPLHFPAAPLAAPLHFDAAPLVAAPGPFSFSVATSVPHVPTVTKVVERPAEVSTVAGPLIHHAPFFHNAPLIHHAPAPLLHHAPAPIVHAAPARLVHAAPVIHTEATGVHVPLGIHDCVTPGGCALKAALLTGLPSATVGSTSVSGRKKREADPLAEAEADPYYYYYNSGINGHGAHGLTDYGLGYYTNPYAGYFGYPYYFGSHLYPTANLVAPAALTVAPAPVAVAPIAAPAVVGPVVETTHKKVTYTHLGAHPIQPTTVIQTESRLV